LDADEIAYILGKDEDSQAVRNLIEDSKKIDAKQKEKETPDNDFLSGTSQKEDEKEPDSQSKAPKGPDKKQKNLTEF